MADQKTFVPLENNPEVMSKLAHKLGLSINLGFHDVYSLTEPELVSILPRPAHALLFTYPTTETAETFYNESSSDEPVYNGSGEGEPVMFYHQTIHHACGLIGLLHCTTNGFASTQIQPESDLARLVAETMPLKPGERAQYLHDSQVLDAAHDAAAHTGDSAAPPRGQCPPNAFIAFVKGKDGHLYELEGRRKGPIDRGALSAEADVLSEEALVKGPFPFLNRERKAGSGNVNFSCTVLA